MTASLTFTTSRIAAAMPGPERAGDHRAEHHRDHDDPRRHERRQPQRRRGRTDAADDQLPLAADVHQPRTGGDDHREARERDRRRPQDDLLELARLGQGRGPDVRVDRRSGRRRWRGRRR